ncbi:PAQR family membrane homeostasis protein TrhA [Achromobacter ruhlandii]|uniref:PAQR family membrane homeostasis protein TrhA n=1 Tax=Achromobacter ruhlandii TaxID=72557 RepID=UPI003D1B2130
MFPNDRRQTPGEEIANTISHGLGAAGALAAAPILIVAAARQGDAAFIAGAAVFAASMCLLYLASTIYHALPENRAKRLFNVLDHSAIYLLIAGTYTPFALGALRGPLCLSLIHHCRCRRMPRLRAQWSPSL